MTQAYYYSSTAVQTQLNAGISNSALSCQVASTVGWPSSYPYVIAIDYGAATEELCTVTANNLGLLTITRGFDSTSAQTHGIGAVVRHVYCGKDANDFRVHEGNSAGVHGLTGSVVGTSDTQTLTNKTLTSPTINGGTWNSATLAGGTISGTFTSTSSAVVASAAGTVPLTIQGFTSQSADLFDVKNSAGTVMAAITAGGRLTVSPTLTTSASEVINAPSGLTADIVDWQVNGSTLSKITSVGAYNGPNLVLSGNATTTVPLSITATNATSVNIANIASAQGTGLSLTSNGSLYVNAPGSGNTGTASAYFTTSAIAPDSTNVMVVTNYSGGTIMSLPNVNPTIGAAGASFGVPMLITSGNSSTDAFVVNNTSTSSSLLMKLQASGTNKLTVDESGNVVAAGTLAASNITTGAWTSFTPVAGGSITPGNATYIASYALIGKICIVEIVFNAGSTTVLAGSGGASMTLPFTSANRAGARWTGSCTIIPAGTTSNIPTAFDIAPNATTGTITATNTFPNLTSFNLGTVGGWTTAGIIRISVVYETA